MWQRRQTSDSDKTVLRDIQSSTDFNDNDFNDDDYFNDDHGYNDDNDDDNDDSDIVLNRALVRTSVSVEHIFFARNFCSAKFWNVTVGLLLSLPATTLTALPLQQLSMYWWSLYCHFFLAIFEHIQLDMLQSHFKENQLCFVSARAQNWEYSKIRKIA